MVVMRSWKRGGTYLKFEGPEKQNSMVMVEVAAIIAHTTAISVQQSINIPTYPVSNTGGRRTGDIPRTNNNLKVGS
jgi:hypothetical protein